MSDLQIGLILLGVLLILAVVVFNWWQDRRIRQRMQAHLSERTPDPLMGPEGAHPGRREPGLGMAPPASEGEPAVAPGDDDATEIDPAIELVIDVGFVQPVDAASLYAAVSGLNHTGTKPVRIFAEAEAGGHHVRLRPDTRYVALQFAVLLANRSGALSDVEWSRLWTAAQGIAQAFDGHVEGPELDEVLRRGAELDARCAGLDAQVGLQLGLRAPRDARAIAAAMTAMGFAHSDGVFIWPSRQGPAHFSVLFDGQVPGEERNGQVQRLEFLLDLPNSPADEQAFSRMASVGRDLAGQLDGVLLDDQGHVLPEHADAVLDGQLHERYQRLEEAGYPAGDARTARVFS
ncbi:MAG: cell division protein ZipA C-terminal FtsZ-binding domain-containing protein [Castellaniella sp.]